MMHVGGGAISFFADPIGSNGEVWFALALNGSGVPFEAVRLSALKLYLVLRDVELDAFIYYDGMGGFRFLWTWGVLDPDELPEGIGDLHAGLGRELHRLMERRFVDTPERGRIGRWLGYDGPVTTLRVEDRAGGTSDRSKPADSDLVHFIVNDPRGGPIVPVPWSLNPPGNRAARPVDRSDLFRFDPDRHGTPQASVRLRRRFALPLNFARAALRVLEGAS